MLGRRNILHCYGLSYDYTRPGVFLNVLTYLHNGANLKLHGKIEIEYNFYIWLIISI
jgi:hypothetical protein